MEQQYTRITTSLFEAIQKVTTGVSEQKQEVLSEEKKEETVAASEPVETNEAMTPEFEKKFAETPKGVEVHMKHKETGKIVKNKFIGTHSAVAAAKKHIADMEKKGYEVHAKKLIEQEEQIDEEKDIESIVKKSLTKIHGPGEITFKKTSNGGHMVHHENEYGDLHQHQYDPKTGEVKPAHGVSYNEEIVQTNEAQTSAAARYVKAKAKMSHQASTTMKHVMNPTAGEKKAAKDIKPGVKGFKDRYDMLKSAEARGALKEDEDQHDETIIKEDLNIDVPEQFTFKDYLTAVTSLVGSELEEHQIVAVAYEAFRTQEEDIILEELTRDDLKQKMKAHMDAGHQISGEKFSMKDGKPYGEYVVTDKETGVRRKYIHHGSTRRVENMGSRTKKDAKAND